MTEREPPPLETLDKGIREFREKHAPKKPKEKPGNAAIAMRVVTELLSGCIFGAAAGYFLDKWLNTSPFLFIVCFFLGTAGGFLTVIRTMKVMESEEDSEDSKG